MPGVGQALFEGGAGEAGEGGAHAAVGAGEDEVAHHRVALLGHEDVVGRDAHFVEEDLALVEGALAELVQRLALAHARKVKRHERDRAARPVASVQVHVQHGVGRDRSVGHPRRLLPADDPVVALLLAPEVEPDTGRCAGVSHEHGVGAMLRLGDGPAADEAPFGVVDVGRNVLLD